MLRKSCKKRKQSITLSMKEELLELYSQYLIISPCKTTATGLSALINGEISHDKITRFLAENNFGNKTLWTKGKKLIREYEKEDGCLIFDDTIVEKEHMDENAVVSWHFDHSKNRHIKGINILTAFYAVNFNNDNIFQMPLSYEIIKKTEVYQNKEGKDCRKSSLTKNEMMLNQIRLALQNRIKFKYILADSWFASTENMSKINKFKKFFIFDMKSNRLFALTKTDKFKGKFIRVDKLSIKKDTPIKGYLKGLEFQVTIIKQVFKNKDGSTGVRFLVTNDHSLNFDQITTIYKKRWKVEEYHKSIKQNTSIGKSPAYSERAQSNHIFAAIYSFIMLEKVRLKKGLNHFHLKALIYAEGLKASFAKWGLMTVPA